MAGRGVDVSLVRGGTSKGVFLPLATLPVERSERDAFVLALMGSPDPMQIDGLGGTHSSTSKVVGVAASQDPDVDVEYLFLQVGIDEAAVDDSGNCGNLSYAVGPWAVETGLVEPSDGAVELTLLNRNTGRRLRSVFEVVDGVPRRNGDHVLPGVPGSASPVRVEHLDPGGAVSGRVLPTDSPVGTWVTREGRDVRASLVDVASPVLLVRADDLGLTGREDRAELSSRTSLLETLEDLRQRAAQACGLTGPAETHRAVPRISIVSSAQSDDEDLHTQNLSMQRVHHAVPATTALCVAAAARIEGTVAHDLVAGRTDPDTVRVGHPRGVVTLHVAQHDDGTISAVGATGTSRTLMTGTAYPGGGA